MIDEEIKGQTSIFDQGIWSGKTSQAHSQATKGKTSNVSSKKQPKSSRRMPLFLNLQKGDGLIQDASWETGGQLLGEYTMHSFGESPKEENASHLSQILEEEAPQKYSLSAKACQGILNRASKRGKQLPEILKEALENQVSESVGCTE